MKNTDKAMEVSAQTTRKKFDGVLLTIRSRKSFFEVTQAIEKTLQRFHVPKLMEYVTHGDRAGVELTSTPLPRPSQSSGTSNRAPQCASQEFPSSRSSTSSGTPSSPVACSSTPGPPAWAPPRASAFPSGTARRHESTWSYRRRCSAHSRKRGGRRCPPCSTARE